MMITFNNLSPHMVFGIWIHWVPFLLVTLISHQWLKINVPTISYLFSLALCTQDPPPKKEPKSKAKAKAAAVPPA